MVGLPDSDASSPPRSLTARIIAIMEMIARSPRGISVRGTARETGFDRSAVGRILTQLRDLGVVSVSEDTGMYGVGPRLESLGEALHQRNSAWSVAERVLREVVEQVDETCYFIVREGDHVRFGERIDCHRPIRYLIEPGTTSPLHVGAAGRAVLLGMSSGEVADYLRSIEFTPFTPTTLSEDEVMRQLHEDRLRGYAVSDGERVEGGRGIAAPVFGREGVCIGAVLLTWPASRFHAEAVPQHGAIAVTAAAEISRGLGHPSARRIVRTSRAD